MYAQGNLIRGDNGILKHGLITAPKSVPTIMPEAECTDQS